MADFRTTLTLGDVILQLIITAPAILAGVAAILAELRKQRDVISAGTAGRTALQAAIAERVGVDAETIEKAHVASGPNGNGAAPKETGKV